MIRAVVADGRAEFEALAGLAGRGGAPGADVEQAVRQIIEDVRAEGDSAVVRYAAKFDGPDAAPGGRISSLSRAELKAAFESLPTALAYALLHAAENIRNYHKKQAAALAGYEEKFPGEGGAEGVVIGQIVRGLARVGIYVPGGTAAYPSTVLMNAIPAMLAGVGEIVMVTPPRKSADAPGGGAANGCGIVNVESAGAGGIPSPGEFATDDCGVATVEGCRAGGAATDDCGVVAVEGCRAGGTPAQGEFATDAAILGAAYVAGVDRVILAGGAQAVAALAYGTDTFPRVDKIVGPGNTYVATAKRLLYGVVDIDMIAGPSEILVIADETANAAFAAADLLSQAEHDPRAASILLTTDPGVAAAVGAHLASQLEALSRADTARGSIGQNGLIILCRSEDEMAALANEIAPEHLEILTADPFGLLVRIRNAGSVFLGPWTPEPVGDYYSGTNHVLPTSGTARYASPLGVYDFVKRMSYTRYTEAALKKAKDDIIEIGTAEGLTAHVNAVKIRFSEG
ncbi:MAG: histidinol dehydrogenase [Clostridiales Family XIII bacterium]|jgi:histidinol dehydrogenase|nr:histidinol dehydrogenase [Clostridiales Family XIII bacterium]